MSEYVLSAVLEMKDRMTATIKAAQKNVSGFRNALEEVPSSAKRAASATEALGRSGTTAARGIEKANDALGRFGRGNHRATVSVRDMATPAIDRIRRRLDSIKPKDIAVNVVQRGGSKLTNGLGNIASGMVMNTSMQMLGGAGVGLGIYSAIKGYMDFEQTMSGVKAISGATDEEFQKLTQSALDMGAKTKFTTTEAAQALTYMGMAGWKTDEMISGLPGIMNLAAASGEDLASVSDIVTDAMTSFKMEAKDSAEFADVLAAAATNSNTSVGKMGYTFKYVAPLAGALGYTIQDTALAIGAMADGGIKGEMAGTSLRALFTRLISPTKEVNDAMATLSGTLGHEFTAIDKSTGKMKPLKTVLKDLRTAFKGLNEAQQGQVASELAGQEGMSGLLAIVNESDDKFDALSKAIDGASGSAEKMAKIRLDNLAGDLTMLSSAWQVFTTNLLGGKTSNGLRSFTQEVTELINRFNKNIQDGLDVGDVFDVVGKAVIDLKNKFIQLDGVGSILAGGALAYGLYRIAKLGKNAVDAIKGLAGTSAPGMSGRGTGGASNMVVNANTVIVNGKTSGGGTVVASGGGGAKSGGSGKAGRSGGYLGRAMLAMDALATVYDIYSAAPGERGATAIKGGGELIGMAGGQAIGAAIGTAILPGIGTAIGAVLGGTGGGLFGHYLGNGVVNGTFGMDRLNSMKEEMSPSGYEMGMDDSFDKNTAAMEETAKIRSDAIAGTFQGAVDAVKGSWADVPNWYDSEVCEPMGVDAYDAGDTIGSALAGAASTFKGAWDGIAGWFEANVVGPLQAKIHAIESSAPQLAAQYTSGEVPADAVGDYSFSGGLAQINEHGGELIDLPQGSRIYPAGETRQIISREVKESGTNPAPSVTVTGNTFVVREEADVDKIAYAIRNELEMAYANNGGA